MRSAARSRSTRPRIKSTIKLPRRAEADATAAHRRSPASLTQTLYVASVLTHPSSSDFVHQVGISSTPHKRAREEISVSGSSASHPSSSASPASKKRSRRDEGERPSPHRHYQVPGAPGLSVHLISAHHVAHPAPQLLRMGTAPSTIALTSAYRPELDVFFQNVMGIDFTVHGDMLLAQGLAWNISGS
ncbi:hypothetical protein DFH09DRAFT_203545 [Mycena vulgaris]|nr:hypothetical protein DFH09DRAFT_203545 [Mycena vulgaris]